MGSQLFTASGTFTWPDGVTSADVEAWGGGAGGADDAGGGGGGGAYAKKTVSKDGSTATVTVGGGGSHNVDGSDSSFTQSGVEVLARGGSKGVGTTGGNGGAAAASTGTTKHSGGKGGDAPNEAGGGGGSSAGTGADGGDGSPGILITGGNGGAAPSGGGGGGQGGDQDSSGVSGAAPGGGGGGAGSGENGAGGAAGKVLVTWTDPSGSTYNDSMTLGAIAALVDSMARSSSTSSTLGTSLAEQRSSAKVTLSTFTLGAVLDSPGAEYPAFPMSLTLGAVGGLSSSSAVSQAIAQALVVAAAASPLTDLDSHHLSVALGASLGYLMEPRGPMTYDDSMVFGAAVLLTTMGNWTRDDSIALGAVVGDQESLGFYYSDSTTLTASMGMLIGYSFSIGVLLGIVTRHADLFSNQVAVTTTTLGALVAAIAKVNNEPTPVVGLGVKAGVVDAVRNSSRSGVVLGARLTASDSTGRMVADATSLVARFGLADVVTHFRGVSVALRVLAATTVPTAAVVTSRSTTLGAALALSPALANAAKAGTTLGARVAVTPAAGTAQLLSTTLTAAARLQSLVIFGGHGVGTTLGARAGVAPDVASQVRSAAVAMTASMTTADRLALSRGLSVLLQAAASTTQTHQSGVTRDEDVELGVEVSDAELTAVAVRLQAVLAARPDLAVYFGQVRAAAVTLAAAVDAIAASAPQQQLAVTLAVAVVVQDLLEQVTPDNVYLMPDGDWTQATIINESFEG